MIYISVYHDSDEDVSGEDSYSSRNKSKIPKLENNDASYNDRSSHDDESRSSENSSSPNDQYGDHDIEDNNSDFMEEKKQFHDSPQTNYDDSTHQDSAHGTTTDIGWQLMSKMGFKKGKGLGKLEDGMREPIKASTQKGKRGLGHQPSSVGELSKDLKWAPNDEVPKAKEEPVRCFFLK